jgi:hypothetical protein
MPSPTESSSQQPKRIEASSDISPKSYFRLQKKYMVLSIEITLLRAVVPPLWDVS